MTSLPPSLIVSAFFLGLMLSSSIAVAESGLSAESREYKLLLKPGRLSDKQQAMDYYGQAIQQAAIQSGLTVKPAKHPLKQKASLYTYLDTVDQQLNAKHIILRVVQPLKNNQPEDKNNVTLKYRVSGDKIVKASELNVSPSYPVVVKFETDVVGFIDAKVGHNEQQNSLSAQIKGLPAIPARTVLSQYAELFPTLATLGIKPESPLNIVGSTILNEELSLGSLHFTDGTKTKLAMVIWSDIQSHKLIVGEISFAINLKPESPARVEQSQKFFDALQQQLKDDLLPGATKTSVVYQRDN